MLSSEETTNGKILNSKTKMSLSIYNDKNKDNSERDPVSSFDYMKNKEKNGISLYEIIIFINTWHSLLVTWYMYYS